jgi:hypothetical protein
MQSNKRNFILRAMIAVAMLILLAGQVPTASAKKLFKGEWVITITAPDSPTGNRFGTQTFTVLARKFDFPPSPLPLNKLTATAQGGTAVQGVWRQVGKKFSLTFEIPCEAGAICGTVILRGTIKPKDFMRGDAIVVWDTRDDENVARYQTVNGSFEGFQQ